MQPVKRASTGRAFRVALFIASLALGGGLPPLAALAAEDATLNVPATLEPGAATALSVSVPGSIAALEGRVLVDTDMAELIGIASLGGGQTLAPVKVDGGYAFAAYDIRSTKGRTTLKLVVVAKNGGTFDTRVLIDAAANSQGKRVNLIRNDLSAKLRVGGSIKSVLAPAGTARSAPGRPAEATRAIFGHDVITPDDIDTFRAAWYRNREVGSSCDPVEDAQADANSDGCLDVVDLQALVVDQGKPTRSEPGRRTTTPTGSAIDTRFTASLKDAPPPQVQAFNAPHTFVVRSTADTPDAAQGDGICADSQGFCTLRAAMMEANFQTGLQRIEFDLSGPAPVTIQMTSHLPNLGSQSAQVFVDGYSQPGSQPNTAQYGTNAIPGVELRGQGIDITRWGFYVARPGNTVRGMLMNNGFRGVFVDGPNASDNRIIGNWMGFNKDNSLFSPRGIAGVQINGGAKQNKLGMPSLADRNVIGNYDKGIWFSGSGTDGNVTQNNVLCIRPNGLGAVCHTGIDHDFGPKDGLIGGLGPNERNVIGPTCCNAIELSHGWDPSKSSSTGGTPEWWVTGHRIVGNWLGFKPDGHYDPNFRSAFSVPEADNGQAVNIYDGSSSNIMENNYVAAAYDGFTVAMGNSSNNIIRNNVFGESPWGEPAPMAGWGGYFRLNTKVHLVESNVFRNVGIGGIGLIESNVRNITISKNIVTATNGKAIHLEPDPSGQTPGANGFMPPPTFTNATETSISGTGINGSTVEVFRASRPLGAFGLPVEYLGSAVVAGGTWLVTYAHTLQTGQLVSATQTRNNGETSEMAANVYAGGPPPPPTADFTWTQVPGSLRINFTDTSTASPTAWSWSFGDGGTSTQQNPSRVYGASATYQVTLTATNGSGSNSKTQSVTVAPLPPGFVHASNSFSRSVTAGWGNADVGGSYTLEGPSANFAVASGVGNLLLSANGSSNAAYLTDVAVRDVNARARIRIDKLPVGAGQQYAYLSVRRNGANAYRPKIIVNPNGSVMVHSGILANGSESSLGNAVVVNGLTVTTTSFVWLRAEVTGASPTTVRVKAWADGAAEPANWQFTATNSTAAVQGPGGVGVLAYTSSSNAPVTFSFDDFTAATPGAAPPPPAPLANFSASQQAGTLTVNFSDTSTGAPTSWSWSFGDGTSSIQQHPTKTYASAGDYQVTLTATNANGSSSVTKTVSVVPIPAPVANFSASQQQGTLTVNFSDTSTGAPTSWSWSFGDGTSSTQQHPTKTYASAGDYQVTLTATNGGGSNSVTKTVTVVPIPAFITYAADAFGRTSSNGWGNADTGGAYTLQGTASNFSVAAGTGTIVVPTAGLTRSALLGSPSAQELDISFRVRADKVATGGAYFIYAVARRNNATNSEYRPRLLLNANGTISAHASVMVNGAESPLGTAVVIPGLTQSANGWIRFRAQVTGSSPTTIRVKAWADGQAEPQAWNYSVTSSSAGLQSAGSLGLRLYTNSSISNAPVTFSFDDYLVRSP